MILLDLFILGILIVIALRLNEIIRILKGWNK